ncbi:MAG: hypothetical protein IJ228_01595 [Succinivibrio sp.]|nr:hypothetical protein [Succinivibrio sp.]
MSRRPASKSIPKNLAYTDLVRPDTFAAYGAVWCAGYSFVTLELAAVIKTTHCLEVAMLSSDAAYASPRTVYGVPCLTLDALPSHPRDLLVLITAQSESERNFWQSWCKELHLPCALFDQSSFDKTVNALPPEIYLSCAFYANLQYAPDLEHPRTFNEKVNYLKLHGYRKIHTTLTDKAAVKEHVADLIGEEYLIPTLGVYKDLTDFKKAYSSLPDAFVVKCTHDSGSARICNSKAAFNLSAACKVLQFCLKRNYYFIGREPAYRNITPRLIAEPLICSDTTALVDYKFHCVNGEALMLEAISRRGSADGARGTFFDAKTLLRYGFSYTYPLHERLEIAPPEVIAHMRELCRVLAADLPFVRLDFYYIGDRIYFGEYTLYPASGVHPFKPTVWDFILGDLISPAVPHNPEAGETRLRLYDDPSLQVKLNRTDGK